MKYNGNVKGYLEKSAHFHVEKWEYPFIPALLL
jgi:hypothetical protein